MWRDRFTRPERGVQRSPERSCSGARDANGAGGSGHCVRVVHAYRSRAALRASFGSASTVSGWQRHRVREGP
jgi:hypothetical protein